MPYYDLDRFDHHQDPMVRRLSGVTRAAVPEGTDGWTWALPLVFQSLASPSTARFPQHPGGGPHEVEPGVLGYWAALQGFLTYVLGWRRHDRGLRWWIDQGRPTADPRLAFLAEVWGADGAVEPYLFWVQSLPRDRNPGAFFQDHAWHDDDLDLGWSLWQTEQELAKVGAYPRPFGLHLENGDHIADLGPVTVGAHDMPPRMTYNSTSQEAVFETQTLAQAFDYLAAMGGALPATAGAEWRVHLYARTAGFLGTYRQSWRTGFWFSGPHRHHSPGN